MIKGSDKKSDEKAESSRALSHLSSDDTTPDNPTPRMTPGGMFICNGIREEYTGRVRLDVVAQLAEQAGDEYKFHVIGDENGPKSLLTQRGVPNEKGGFDFADISKHVADGCKLMTVEEAREAFLKDEE